MTSNAFAAGAYAAIQNIGAKGPPKIAPATGASGSNFTSLLTSTLDNVGEAGRKAVEHELVVVNERYANQTASLRRVHVYPRGSTLTRGHRPVCRSGVEKALEVRPDEVVLDEEPVMTELRGDHDGIGPEPRDLSYEVGPVRRRVQHRSHRSVMHHGLTSLTSLAIK